MHRFMDFYIPMYMMDSVERYVEKGVIPGDFLQAVICNKLKESVMLADETNICNLPAYADYFYNKAPSVCWGSEENMLAWNKRGGLHGRDSVEQADS